MMPFHHVSLPGLPPSIGHLTAIHPLKGDSQESITLLALNTQAELWRLELRSGSAELCTRICIPDFNPMQPVQMVTSSDGSYVAISNRFGRHAAVYDLVHAQEKCNYLGTNITTIKVCFPWHLYTKMVHAFLFMGRNGTGLI
uniref:Uncharacterized protein n=1 Tax=Paenibacillus polymyxa TaxID=1406 RepID=A0AAE9TK85_PAEPO